MDSEKLKDFTKTYREFEEKFCDWDNEAHIFIKTMGQNHTNFIKKMKKMRIYFYSLQKKAEDLPFYPPLRKK